MKYLSLTAISFLLYLIKKGGTFLVEILELPSSRGG
jgi:hypothetical protein